MTLFTYERRCPSRGRVMHVLIRTFLAATALLLFTSSSRAQQVARFVKLQNCNGYYEYLPEGYNAHPDKRYPLLLFIHGSGERGDGTPSELKRVLRNGPPALIDQGKFPASFTVNGKTFSFIVISPQFMKWPVDDLKSSDIQSMLDYIKAHYRVDPSRIYLTGLSMGGGVTWNFAGMSKEAASELAAIVPVCGASFPSGARSDVIASQNLPVWALHNQYDPTVTCTNSIKYVQQINAYKPTPDPLAKLTIFPTSGHDAWSKAYDPNYRENGMNVYEWMLQYSREAAAPPPPPPPAVPADTRVSTANDTVRPYQTPFSYGINPGSYHNGWDDEKVAAAGLKAGVHSSRPTLPDYFVGQWGYDIRLKTFDYYQNTLKFNDLTVFLEKPRPEYQDETTYPGSDSRSKGFANLYEPIWDNGDNGTPVNDKNYFAVYIYNVVKRYGKYVRFWEIWNEPDLTYDWQLAQGAKDDPASWWNSPPSAQSLNNLKAPVYSYVRMLRIAYEVIKKIDPDDYVTTGGLGYPSFLDAVLRYTDNPDGGKVSKDYPLKGGAYFDVLSYHCYPAFSLKFWDDAAGGFRYERNSDRAADAVINARNGFEQVLEDRGYDGKEHPKKLFILTEVNIARKPFQDHIGSDEAQRNFAIKALVEAQKEDIKQVYFYGIGESADYDAATSEYQLMGLYQNLTRDAPGSEKLTQEGVAFKTTSQLLYGYRYDAARTAALKLPAGVEGAAFKKGAEYRYVLWAETHKDRNEGANAVYSFPSGLQTPYVKEYQWNYAVDAKAAKVISSVNIPLTGTPVFFSVSQPEVVPNKPPVAKAGSDTTIVLPVDSVLLNGSASSDPDGRISAYKWVKKSGPASFRFDNPSAGNTMVRNLTEGTYVFTLTVTDDKGATAADNMTVIVKPEPAVPADTTETPPPADTTKPTEPPPPADTTKPEDPAPPTDTTQPSEPTPPPPADTTQPAEPTTPPADTTQPSEPPPPADTTQPVEPPPPADTTKPSEPTPPADTAKPSEPAPPADTAKPAIPGDTTKPAGNIDYTNDGGPANHDPHSHAADAKVWPNPFVNRVNVKMDNSGRGRMDIGVYNASGRPVKTFSVTKSGDKWQGNFDLSGIPAGIYFMNFRMSDRFITVKVIKMK